MATHISGTRKLRLREVQVLAKVTELETTRSSRGTCCCVLGMTPRNAEMPERSVKVGLARGPRSCCMGRPSALECERQGAGFWAGGSPREVTPLRSS